MKKMIFQCVSNVLLFSLFGLAFLFPFREISQSEFGFNVTFGIFPVLLIASLIAYPILYYVLAKKYCWGKKDNSELSYSDEREKIIVAEATKIAYKVLVGGVAIIIAVIGGLRFFFLFTGMNLSIYSVAIALLTLLLDAAAISYCVKWCLEYKK